VSTPKYGIAQQGCLGNAKTAQNFCSECGLGMVERELEFGNAQHVLLSIKEPMAHFTVQLRTPRMPCLG
jgi:hypothetical protein